MNCKKIWYNLPKSLGVSFIWNNLPNKIDKEIELLQQSKPACYSEILPQGAKKTTWYNILKQATILCELEQC